MTGKYLLAFALAAALCAGPSQADKEPYSAEHEKVEKRFQSDEEKTAKDAIWTQDDVFKVGVFDDGTLRNGYAEYVCLVLYDYGFRGEKVWVQILDIVKLVRDGDWVKLGESHCL